jgi:DNA-binding HxlR family transcriptional regulator
MSDDPQRTDLPKIGEREMAALREVARYLPTGLYRWRQVSMRKLERHGMVERVAGNNTKSRPAWRITEAGGRVLNGH